MPTQNFQRNLGGEKQAEYLGLWGKPIKPRDKRFAPSTLDHRHPLEYQRMPRLRLPFTQVLEARASK